MEKTQTESSPVVIQSVQSDGVFNAGIILTETNYDVWFQIMEMHLVKREKLSYIRSSTKSSEESSKEYEKWYTYEIWDALSKAFYDGSDELQVFTLNQKAFSTKQNGQPLSKFYGELIEIFRELDHRDKVVMKDPEDVVIYRRSVERLRVHIFLAGLDEEFNQVRGEILRKEIISDLEECYSLIRREDARQSKLNKKVDSETSAMIARQQPQRKFVDKSSLHCTHCKKNGHTKEHCFEIIGYPDWWDTRKKNTKHESKTAVAESTSTTDLRKESLVQIATSVSSVPFMVVHSDVWGPSKVSTIGGARCNNNGIPKNFPVGGMLPHLLLNVHRIHDYSTEVLEKTQCTFLFKGPWFANMDILATVDPANVHHIMSSNFSNFPKGPEFKRIFDILGDGIFNSDSDLWKNQRRFAQALMNRHSFYKFLVKSNQAKLEKGLIPILDHMSKQGTTVDLQDLFQRFTFDSTSLFVTGYDPGCLSIEFPKVRFLMALEDVEESIFYRHVVPESLWKLQRWLGIGEEKKLKKAKETLDSVIFELIQRKRREINEEILSKEIDGVDLLASYMHENKTIMGELKCADDNFLRDTVLNFMIAGRDTTSSALTWFFWLISKNPKAETKIREELTSIVPAEKLGKWWDFDTQKLNQLVYLHGALCEALRLYPPVPFQHKVPLVPHTLPSGHRAVPRTKILFSLYAMGRMKSIWGEDCLEFRPERWISESGGIKWEPSYKFFSFNAGPRTCLGKEVAFTQMKAVAAGVIHNYDIQVVEGQRPGPNVSIILYMKHGLKVRVHDRWAK
ncbi:cytochrome P450 family 96 subfamily A polypeptide 10 [Citrus sinensis]|uniref:Cytochrome P450 family 96 subfamily A polypeptide 10 n=1 Tax=Citrus sinensis TaxID=2711 RepID=A0ACB8JKC3_CITSI|nr:cytochrome P450 family 96 subfamily A polypeptide 10 [Citrus sinensis]